MKEYTIFEALVKVMKDNGHSAYFVSNYANIANYSIHKILKGKQKFVTPNIAERILFYIQAFNKTIKIKITDNEVRGMSSIRFGYRKIEGMYSRQPSQRPGIAHLCVNGILICGEQDIHNVRYYRAHEEFLNQVEICPTCKKSFLDAVTLWSANQPKKGK